MDYICSFSHGSIKMLKIGLPIPGGEEPKEDVIPQTLECIINLCGEKFGQFPVRTDMLIKDFINIAVRKMPYDRIKMMFYVRDSAGGKFEMIGSRINIELSLMSYPFFFNTNPFMLYVFTDAPYLEIRSFIKGGRVLNPSVPFKYPRIKNMSVALTQESVFYKYVFLGINSVIIGPEILSNELSRNTILLLATELETKFPPADYSTMVVVLTKLIYSEGNVNLMDLEIEEDEFIRIIEYDSDIAHEVYNIFGNSDTFKTIAGFTKFVNLLRVDELANITLPSADILRGFVVSSSDYEKAKWFLRQLDDYMGFVPLGTGYAFVEFVSRFDATNLRLLLGWLDVTKVREQILTRVEVREDEVPVLFLVYKNLSMGLNQFLLALGPNYANYVLMNETEDELNAKL